MSNYKKFLYQYAMFVGLISLPLFVSLITIIRSYENMAFKEIAPLQQKLNAIYGPALNDNTFSYKVELFKQRKPAIMALGSSRVLQMREQFFTSSFANCGLAMSHLNEGVMFLEEILKFHRPEVILFCLDFWWFNAAYLQPQTFPQHQIDGNGNIIYKIRQPFIWLRNKKVSLRQLIDVTVFNNTKNNITKYENLGITAIRYSKGFRPDGSYFNSDIWFGLNPTSTDIKFKKTINSIETGGDRFEYGDKISPERLKQFQRILEICRGKNVALIVFLPPVAPTVYGEMAAKPDKYAYIKELQNYIYTLPLETYDFQDISEIPSMDCEFSDGIHYGDVFAQRILLKIVEQNPDSILRQYLNIPLMEAKIKEFSGRVLTKYNKFMYYREEMDFLHLGCNK